jgi:hypothetical protein
MYADIQLQDIEVRRFFNFVNERHAIYLRKTRGDPWPWTTDPILQKYHFPNVFRALDRTCIALMEQLIERYWGNPELFFNVAIFRGYGWAPTQKAIGFIDNYEPAKYVNMVENLRKAGYQTKTRAYRIQAKVQDAQGNIPHSMIEQLFGIAFADLWKKRNSMKPDPDDTLETAFNRLIDARIPSYGPFICYEVVNDLHHTRYLQGATDAYTWAYAGKGVQESIIRLMGLERQDKKYTPAQDECISVMRTLLQVAPDYLSTWVQPPPQLEMVDLTHCLGSYNAYVYIKGKEGRKHGLRFYKRGE